MAQYAYLDLNRLPLQFSYPPYIQDKRVTAQRTAGGVVTQRNSTEIVHGDGSIEWSCEGCTPHDFRQFNLWYKQTNKLFQFDGYWGERYLVRFSSFDKPRVRSRIFTLSGQFQVVCVLKDYDPSCN